MNQNNFNYFFKFCVISELKILNEFGKLFSKLK
ncbi:hypothetical protein PRV_03000 [Mycoplasma parvum str. Indiana]|uniref:Uncharacterized protein n=1 Tax=Mycoplasma parvum str. Indiana TaxID=1403316 RepID=U5NDD0_9MOLU|nr:hypothetical protein PRV_03000 [Mycoplasma parvum str. Indiana]